MNDPATKRLIAALDGLDIPPSGLRHDLDLAAERLRALKRIGVLAEGSPYLAFITRLHDDSRAPVLASA
jgi:hypothetical protein